MRASRFRVFGATLGVVAIFGGLLVGSAGSATSPGLVAVTGNGTRVYQSSGVTYTASFSFSVVLEAGVASGPFSFDNGQGTSLSGNASCGSVSGNIAVFGGGGVVFEVSDNPDGIIVGTGITTPCNTTGFGVPILITSGSITITGAEESHAPVAANDSYVTIQGNSLTVDAASGVLHNDTDPDPGTTLMAVFVTDFAHGSLDHGGLNADGSFAYTPHEDFVGVDHFTYQASDGALRSDVITVTVAVLSLASVIDAEPGLSSSEKKKLKNLMEPLNCGNLQAFASQLYVLQKKGSLSGATATILYNWWGTAQDLHHGILCSGNIGIRG